MTAPPMADAIMALVPAVDVGVLIEQDPAQRFDEPLERLVVLEELDDDRIVLECPDHVAAAHSEVDHLGQE